MLTPDPTQGYVLGIECDGATYHSGRSAHLRDVWHENILRARGWNIHRIWSTRWWYHRQEEIDELASVLERAVADFEASSAQQETHESPEVVPGTTEGNGSTTATQGTRESGEEEVEEGTGPTAEELSKYNEYVDGLRGTTLAPRPLDEWLKTYRERQAGP